ncbi:MAG: PSD1 domain-containing protein [Verrucomicrobia bacterium]|nr:PSD1 domain-containing protein [Verrucomicrobiota bacterium]
MSRHYFATSFASLLTIASLGVAAPAPGPASNLPGKLDFARDIAPIFSAKCFACHGPDDAHRKAKLRLDVREEALKSRDGKPAIVASSLAKSELWHRITNKNPDDVMPPKKQGKPLTPQEVALLKKWLEQGAPYAEHWAFVPPVRPAVPKVSNQYSVFSVQSGSGRAGSSKLNTDPLNTEHSNPIDAFISARLAAEKLRPSPPADKSTLLRRLSLDLVGLPPTPEELDAFLADKSPDAWSKQVERLLASPHYGERWGRLWLDAARYADSDGYEKDKRRLVHFYRDWVIAAFNRDLPYDRFIIEQLAGDQLPGATQDQFVATGFLRNSMLNEEGGIHPEQFRMEAMFDRMDAVGKGVLGLTTACAQCHNHKYDPLTQEEYYRMFAFLNNDHEAMPRVFTAPEQEKIASLRREMDSVAAALKQQLPDWQSRMAKWETEAARNQPDWTVLRDMELITDNSQRYYPQSDGSLLASGWAPTKFTASFQVTNKLENISAIRLELFTDPNLPANGPGRSYKGLFALTEFSVEAAPLSDPKKKTKVKFASATADFDQPVLPLEPGFHDGSTNKRVTGPISFAMDGNKNTAWGGDSGPGRRNTDRVAVFQLATNISFSGGTVLTLNLSQEHGSANANDFGTQNLGRFRISVVGAEKPAVADRVPKKVREVFSIPTAKRTPVQVASVFDHWRTTVPEFASANTKFDALWQQWPEGTTAYALVARTEERMTSVLNRGDWLKPTGSVKPGVPAFLNPLPAGADTSRATFAKWLTDRRSPTTARVFVNRVWQAYFGTGLVETAEDFGRQSAKPSHPELLDWLACEFMEPVAGNRTWGIGNGESTAASAPSPITYSPSPWSVKHLHRLIVHSATYQQSSRVTPESLARDPYNRLLARGPRFRVDAELVRDIALASSGLLNPKIGGRAVMPPAPEFLFKPPASYGDFPWVSETGDERYRRAVYTFRRRSTPFPSLLVFDAPVGDFSCVRRQRSNTPLQALTTLNEPMFMEAAQALALRTLRDGGASDADKLTFAFRRCTARPPTRDEQKELLALLTKQEQRFTGKDADAWKLATADPKNPPALPASATPAKLAAWAAVSRVLLNLDETITKE